MSTRPEYPVVTVKWADHYSVYSQNQSVSDIEGLINEPCVRTTVGFLINENKKQLALAGTVDFDYKDTPYFSDIFICIKKTIISRSDKEEK